MQDARQLCRTEAAQQNIFENIGLYAAAIVAGNVARLGTSHMNKIALGYLVSRFLYVVRLSERRGPLAAEFECAYILPIASPPRRSSTSGPTP